MKNPKDNPQWALGIEDDENHKVYKQKNGAIDRVLFNYKTDVIRKMIKGYPGEYYDSVIVSCFKIHLYPNGVLQKTGKYCKGLKCGEWNYYNENGFLDSTVQYDSFAVVKKTIKY